MKQVKERFREIKEWNRKYADPDDSSMPKQIEYWENPAFDSMSSAQKEMYDNWMAIKWMADEKYPTTRTRPYKAIQRRKSGGNRIIEMASNPSQMLSNIKEAIKQTFQDSEDDDQTFGNKKTSLQNFDGTEYMTLPVLYTNKLKNPDELSTDIFSDLLVYTYAADKYEAMSEIVDPLEVARSLMTDNIRKVQQTRGGVPV